jgi:hypothetical protein
MFLLWSADVSERRLGCAKTLDEPPYDESKDAGRGGSKKHHGGTEEDQYDPPEIRLCDAIHAVDD